MGGLFSKNNNKVNIEANLEETLIESNQPSYSDEKYNKFFGLVNENLKRFYNENKRNSANISISLDKKEFNSKIHSKRIVIDHNKKYIYWKDYIMDYFYRTSNRGYEWSLDLIRIINNEVFLSENRWLSEFFWKEFELRLKPKCLVNQSKLRNDKEKDYSERLNESYCSFNTDSLSINDPTHEYKEYRQKIKSYIIIFKDHIFNTNHPINIIVKYFAKIFAEFINQRIKELKNMSTNIPEQDFQVNLNSTCDEITKLLQKVILKLQTTIMLMYCRTISYQYFIEERDELINLITSLVFSNTFLYDAMINLYKVCINDQIFLFKQKIKSLKRIKPQDLGINEKFCLTEATLAYQKKLLENENNQGNESLINKQHCLLTKNQLLKNIENRLSSPKINENFIPESFVESSIPSSLSMKLNIKENSIMDYNTSPFFEKNNYDDIKVYAGGSDMRSPLKGCSKNTYSYERAIKTLKLLNSYTIPFEKMGIIASIANEITECVNEFWKDMEKVITSSLLNIDADELMSIFIYIIIKAQMPNLLVHMKMIKEFTTTVTKASMMGYYFVTLDASVIYILDLDEKNIKINREKLKSNVFLNKSASEIDEIYNVMNNQK